MKIKLSRTYTNPFGAVNIDSVDDAIFTVQYFGECLKCTFCADKCCSYGADIDMDNIARMEPYAGELAEFMGISSNNWFNDEIFEDLEYPSGFYKRTQVSDGRCVFLNRQSRGCMIHRFCVEKGIDFHALKPMVCSLFPITFDQKLLRPSFEIFEESLICMNTGHSLYHSVRDDLIYYFGNDFANELDALSSKNTKTFN